MRKVRSVLAGIRAGKQLLLRRRPRWLIDDAVAPPDRRRDPGEEVLDDAFARPVGDLLPECSLGGVGRRVDRRFHVQAMVPDVQRPQLRALAQVFPIRTHARTAR